MRSIVLAVCLSAVCIAVPAGAGEVQLRADGETRSPRVAGVPGDFGLDQDDV